MWASQNAENTVQHMPPEKLGKKFKIQTEQCEAGNKFPMVFGRGVEYSRRNNDETNTTKIRDENMHLVRL